MDRKCYGSVPKVILLDTTDSPHLSDLGSCTDDLDADVSPWLDDSVFVISELRGGGIGIPLDITGDQLQRMSARCGLSHETALNIHGPIRRGAKAQLGRRSPVG